jgi:hypothetical protein
MPFWQLARLAPLAQIREALGTVQSTPIQVQAILYGVSGFLQRWQAERRRPEAARDTYVATLAAYWEPVSALFPECLDERQWRMTGIRPANFPQRRIASCHGVCTWPGRRTFGVAGMSSMGQNTAAPSISWGVDERQPWSWMSCCQRPRPWRNSATS